MNRSETHDEAVPALGITVNTAARSMTVDALAYQHLLDESGLSEAEKRELIETLWSVILGFVELGFGVHPLQQLPGTAEEADEENPPQAGTDRVHLTRSASKTTQTEEGCASGAAESEES